MKLFATRHVALTIAVLVAAHASCDAQTTPLRIYAAGSLKNAFDAMVQAFGEGHAQMVYGGSGLLRARLEKGEAADVFASADLAQPRRLSGARHTSQVVVFARNRLCVMARTMLSMNSANLLDRLLDPAVKLVISTPGDDPSGDYAWAMFARAETLHPGAEALLKAKAQLLGATPRKEAVALVAPSVAAPGIKAAGPRESLFLSGMADATIGYCSGAGALLKAVPGLVAIPVPATLSAAPAYGLVVVSDTPAAWRFAVFVMSEAGQAILAKAGLVPVGLPADSKAAP